MPSNPILGILAAGAFALAVIAAAVLLPHPDCSDAARQIDQPRCWAAVAHHTPCKAGCHDR